MNFFKEKKYFLGIGIALFFSLVPHLSSAAPVVSTPANQYADIDAETITEGDLGEHIQNFRSDIIVNADSSIDVTETITYDFSDYQKHGIYRDIPLTQVTGALRGLHIKNVFVTDEHGTPYQFTVTGGDTVHVKIGDPDKTITGVHTYIIHYTGLNAIGYFDDRDEIYWNATGNQWQVPIWEAETHVFLPGEFEQKQLHIASYCGEVGVTDPCVNGVPLYNVATNQTEVVFQTKSDFYYSFGDGMTVAVGFPKGIVAVPVLKWWEKAATYQIATVLIFLLFLTILLFWLFGSYFPEAQKRKQPVIAEYTPPSGISPAQAAYIYNGSNSLQKIVTTEIIYLASRGFLSIAKQDDSLSTSSGKMRALKTIRALGPIILLLLFAFLFSGWIIVSFLVAIAFSRWKDVKNYIYAVLHPSEFILTREKKGNIQELAPYLYKLLGLVTNEDGSGKSLTEIEKDRAYFSFQDVQDSLLDDINARYPDVAAYFKKRSQAFLTLPFFFLALFVFVMTSFVGAALNESFGANVPAMAFLTNGSFIFFTWLFFAIRNFLAVRIARMNPIWYKIAGLREYITVAEKDRLTFQNDPAQSLKIYSELLPYATAFGMEQKWSQVFNGIIVEPPEWYRSSGVWSVSQFSSSMAGFAVGMSGVSNSGKPTSSSSGSSSSGSSGGGFSGGGGGGGGGGSW